MLGRLLIAATAMALVIPSVAQDKKPESPKVADTALREELVKRMKVEQAVREEVAKAVPSTSPTVAEDSKKPEVQAIFQKMARIDRDNLTWLKKVVADKGWPTKSMVGQDGALGAFLIAQHATTDLEFMNTVLSHLRKAYKSGDAEGQWVALMTDRLLVLREKKKQLYGTQLDAKDGKIVPLPIEDEANVDKRRKELGMPPLAEYLKFVSEHADPSKEKSEKKPKSQTKSEGR
jgi:Family of unknown function (DUF6624)